MSRVGTKMVSYEDMALHALAQAGKGNVERTVVPGAVYSLRNGKVGIAPV
jgi:hypothetical protein